MWILFCCSRLHAYLVHRFWAWIWVGSCFCPNDDFSVLVWLNWVEDLMGVIVGVWLTFFVSWRFGMARKGWGFKFWFGVWEITVPSRDFFVMGVGTFMVGAFVRDSDSSEFLVPEFWAWIWVGIYFCPIGEFSVLLWFGWFGVLMGLIGGVSRFACGWCSFGGEWWWSDFWFFGKFWVCGVWSFCFVVVVLMHLWSIDSEPEFEWGYFLFNWWFFCPCLIELGWVSDGGYWGCLT